ncbi:MAG: hypothetical protein AAFQ62_01825 [Pseudomonadota bacterium]
MNRSLTSTLAALTAGLLLSGSALACDYPDEEVALPNGATATEADMLKARREVKDYVERMQVYLSCLESGIETAESKAKDEALDDETRQSAVGEARILSQKYDAAFDEISKVAAEFNAQRSAYLEAQE